MKLAEENENTPENDNQRPQASNEQASMIGLIAALDANGGTLLVPKKRLQELDFSKIRVTHEQLGPFVKYQLQGVEEKKS